MTTIRKLDDPLWKYIPAAKSAKPGYLASKFRKLRKEQEEKAKEAKK